MVEYFAEMCIKNQCEPCRVDSSMLDNDMIINNVFMDDYILLLPMCADYSVDSASCFRADTMHFHMLSYVHIILKINKTLDIVQFQIK